MRHRFQLRHLEKILHRLRDVSEAVDQFILHIHIFLIRFDGGNPLIYIQLQIFILNIAVRNKGVDIAVHRRFKVLFLRPLAL